MSNNKGFIEASLDIDELVLRIQKEGEEEIFECSLSKNEVDWYIEALQSIRRFQRENKNLGIVTFRYEELED
jgi:hypothetical protein